ncbi:MAG: TonB-dependent receptor [Erythrobacter sp.]
MKLNSHKAKLRLQTATAITGALLATGIASPAMAQSDEQAADSGADENTIVVTARKREESLQDVPLAVTAISEEDLERQFFQTVSEIEQLVPNIELADNSFGGRQLNATIRGVGFADVEKSFEPAVGFSIDGVFLGTSGGASIDAFDIASVEVLRGPQGTLFGRNTVGGVINVRRTAPTEEFGVRAKARFGNNGREDYRVVLNTGRFGPFALKAYAFNTNSETFSTNVVTGSPDPLDDNWSFGGALSIEPSADISAVISLDIFDDNSGQQPNYTLSLPGALFCDFTSPAFGIVAPESFGAGCIDASFTPAQESGFSTHIQAFPVVNETDGFSVTSNIDWDVSDTLTLTSVTGYRSSDETLNTDNQGGPLVTLAAAPVQVPLFFATRTVEQEQFSQELRLSGTIGDRLDFVTGLFYLDSTYDLVGGPGPDGVTGFGTIFILGGSAGEFTAGQDTTAVAAFADGSFSVTDKFTISAGIRYSYEEKDFRLAFFQGASAGTATTPSADFDAVTGRLILQYQFTDDIMAFGGWSRGFRSGGFNGRAASINSAGPYDSETVDNFEGGLRMEFADKRIRINPTVFYTQYDDQQVEVSGPSPGGIPETLVQNAASSTIWGVELEAFAQITDDLDFRLAVGYLDAQFDEFFIPDLANPGGPDIDISDQRQIRRAPDWTLSAGLSYDRPITSNLDLFAGIDFSLQDEQAVDLVPDQSGLDRDLIQPESSLDLAIGLSSNNPTGLNWSINAFANDVTDNRDGRIASALDVGVFFFAVGNPTTTYGVEFGVEF